MDAKYPSKWTEAGASFDCKPHFVAIVEKGARVQFDVKAADLTLEIKSNRLTGAIRAEGQNSTYPHLFPVFEATLNLTEMP